MRFENYEEVLVQRGTIQTIIEYLPSNEIVFTLHPLFAPFPFLQTFSTVLLYTTLLWQSTKYFLFIYSVWREKQPKQKLGKSVKLNLCTSRWPARGIRCTNSYTALEKRRLVCWHISKLQQTLEHDCSRLGSSDLWSDPKILERWTLVRQVRGISDRQVPWAFVWIRNVISFLSSSPLPNVFSQQWNFTFMGSCILRIF